MAESDSGYRWRRWLVRSLIGVGMIAALAMVWMQPWAPTGLTDQVTLSVGVDDRHSPLMTGEKVPIEQYASIMLGPTTTLAKQTFVETANGQDVEWIMRLTDLTKEKTGEITGAFSARVVFKRGDREENHVLRFRCLLGEKPGQQLMDLRKDDIATITGKLKLEKRNWEYSRQTVEIVIDRAKVIAVQPNP